MADDAKEYIRFNTAMFKLFYLLVFFNLFCTNARRATANEKNYQPKKNEYLPVLLSYQGVPIDTTLKIFISNYFQSKNIEIISREEGMILIKQEIARAATGITSKEQFKNELYQKQRTVLNSLSFNFKLSPDSSKIFLGWRVISLPPDLRNPTPVKWDYLQTITITDAPPESALRALCDTILASKNLYK